MPIGALPDAERLSVMSSGLPWFAVSQDGVEDDDELARTGDEGLLAGFAGGSELGVIRGDDRVGAAGDQGGHIEAGMHGDAAAGDGAAGAQRAAVAVDRGDVDQRGDLAAAEMAEFREFGDLGAQRRLADARLQARTWTRVHGEDSTAAAADWDLTVNASAGDDVVATGIQDRPGHWTATAVNDIAQA